MNGPRERSPSAPSTPRVERRSEARFALSLPVRVQGYDPDGSAWEEMSTSADTSFGGVSFHLKHAVVPGQALLLALPLPKPMRRHDVTEMSYRVYAIVRSISRTARTTRVGACFLGKNPPAGWAESGGRSRYLLPQDPAPGRGERRRFRRFGIFVAIRLRRLDGSGQEEQTVTENLGKDGARVMTGLGVAKGEVVLVEEVGGDFRTRAEIRGIYIGKDQVPRLNLRFLDAEAPDRLVSLG